MSVAADRPERDILAAENLVKHFRRADGFAAPALRPVRAVDGVSLTLRRGETLGLVGESGCGKSTLGLLLLRLIEPTAGQVVFDGRDITGLGRREMRPLRQRLQMIFQDPYSSLDPRMRIGRIIAEPLVVHATPRSEIDGRVAEAARMVGLHPDMLDRYPHELSGGQRQRVGIARALVVRPELVVADEAVSALDVSIQAQILNLLADLREQLGLSLILISHNIAVVQHLCDRIGVMYLGRLIEIGRADDVVMHPLHPYTQALLSAVPTPDAPAQRARARMVLKGEVPSPDDPPAGCRFHPRCPFARETCAAIEPALRDIAPGHVAACEFAEEIAAVRPA